jgi:hypothetical protein
MVLPEPVIFIHILEKSISIPSGVIVLYLSGAGIGVLSQAKLKL